MLYNSFNFCHSFFFELYTKDMKNKGSSLPSKGDDKNDSSIIII